MSFNLALIPHNTSLLICAGKWKSKIATIKKNATIFPQQKCVSGIADNGLPHDTLMRIVYEINVIWEMKINAYGMSRHFKADYDFGEYLLSVRFFLLSLSLSSNQMQTCANNKKKIHLTQSSSLFCLMLLLSRCSNSSQFLAFVSLLFFLNKQYLHFIWNRISNLPKKLCESSKVEQKKNTFL